MIQDIKTLKEKISLSYDKQIKLHIKLQGGIWRNGFVVEAPSEDFFIFNDDVVGQESIFFMELEKVDPYVNKKEVGDEKL